MQFIVSQKALNDVLSITGKAVTGSLLLPILDNFRFQLADGICWVTGGNNSIFIKKKLEIQTDEKSFDVCISADSLKSLIRALSPQDLIFTLNPAVAEIKATRGTYKLPIVKGEDYMKFPEPDNDGCKIEANVFMDAISRCTPMVSDNSSFAFSNLLIHMGNGITVMGTDSHRLIKQQVSPNTVNSEKIHLAKGDCMVLSGLPCAEELTLFFNSRDIILDLGNDTFVSARRVDVSYPNYEAMISNDFNYKSIINCSQLIQSLKRASIFVNDKDPIAAFNFEGNTLSISASDFEFGEDCNESLTVDFEGEPFEIQLNVEIALSVLTKIKSENIGMYMKAFNMPVIVLENETPSKEFLSIIMPYAQIKPVEKEKV